MKKNFIEPSIRRIELNLSENIAVSAYVDLGIRFWIGMFDCTVHDSGKFLVGSGITQGEIERCRTPEDTKSKGGTIVPEKTVRQYMR